MGAQDSLALLLSYSDFVPCPHVTYLCSNRGDRQCIITLLSLISSFLISSFLISYSWGLVSCLIPWPFLIPKHFPWAMCYQTCPNVLLCRWLSPEHLPHVLLCLILYSFAWTHCSLKMTFWLSIIQLITCAHLSEQIGLLSLTILCLIYWNFHRILFMKLQEWFLSSTHNIYC